MATVGSCGEIYLEDALKNFHPDTNLSNTKKLFDTAIMLLCDPTISNDNARENISKINNILLKNIR